MFTSSPQVVLPVYVQYRYSTSTVLVRTRTYEYYWPVLSTYVRTYVLSTYRRYEYGKVTVLASVYTVFVQKVRILYVPYEYKYYTRTYLYRHVLVRTYVRTGTYGTSTVRVATSTVLMWPLVYLYCTYVL